MYIESVILPAMSQSSCTKRFYIYRGDLEHRSAPGNKYHKLKHHMNAAIKQRYQAVATFGGPHSNHVDAFVNKVVELGLLPIVVVRGEVHAQLTPTLQSAASNGAILFPSQRIDYRKGLASDVRNTVDQFYDDVYWVPEGGGGGLGVLGCKDWADTIMSRVTDTDMICVASGTGTTAEGFAACEKVHHLAVFSALKGADQIVVRPIKPHLQTLLEFDECYHGGFGKMSDELLAFLKKMYELNPNLQLDPIYTGKMLYQVDQFVRQGCWEYGNTLFIHSGGLQGWRGMPAYYYPYHE